MFTIFSVDEFEESKFMNGNIIGKYTEESRQIPRQKLSGKHTQWISGAEEKEKD